MTRYPAALTSLLAGVVDYAGLYPPASLPLDAAVANYLGYRASHDAWALGRFIVPAASLAALGGLAGTDSLRLSVTLAGDLAEQLRLVDCFVKEHPGGPVVECVEGKAVTPDQVRLLADGARGRIGYCEVSPTLEEAGLRQIRDAGLRVKLRMGGVTAEAFPASTDVAGFLERVVATGAPFKATAGLHHPVRGDFRLSYQPDAPSGAMFGYLNLLVAALVAGDQHHRAEVIAALEERDGRRFRFHDDGMTWGSHHWSLGELQALRARFDGFGSCSFREPIDELLPATAG